MVFWWCMGNPCLLWGGGVYKIQMTSIRLLEMVDWRSKAALSDVA